MFYQFLLFGFYNTVSLYVSTSGLPSQAFEYIRYNGGIETEKDYPYRGVDGKCRYDSSLVAATVSDVVNITKVS